MLKQPKLETLEPSKQAYHPPLLECVLGYTLLTGVSLPIGTNSLPNIDPLEFGFDATTKE
jgi:hypothetical protein